MKNIKYLFFATALISSVACSTDGTEITPTTLPNSQKLMYVTAQSQDGTRTVLNTDGSIFWSALDEISLFKETDGAAEKFTSSLTEGTAATSEFSGVAFENAGGVYYAIYPHSVNNTSDYTAQTVSFKIAQTQSYNGEGFSFVKGANPAIAVTSNLENMQFLNVCGGLRLRLKGTDVVQSIEVTSTENLWGDASVNVSDYASKNLPLTLSGGGKTVILDCGAAGVTLSETEDTIFTIILPVQSSDITYKVNLKDKLPVSFTLPALAISRADIRADVSRTITSSAPATGEVSFGISDLASDGTLSSTSAIPTGDKWNVSIDQVELNADHITAMQAALAGAQLPITIKLNGKATIASKSYAMFKQASNLQSVDMTAAEIAVKESANNYINIVPESFIEECASIETLILNKNIQGVFENAAYGCSELNSVTYGEGTRDVSAPADGYFVVESNAFRECTKIVTFDLSWANHFANLALQGCSGIRDLNLSYKGNMIFLNSSGTPDNGSLGGLSQFAQIAVTINSDKTTGATPAVIENGTKWINKAWGEIKYVN